MINTSEHMNWLQEGSKLLSHLVRILAKRALLIQKRLNSKSHKNAGQQYQSLRTLRTSANKRQLVKFKNTITPTPTPALSPTIQSKNGWTDSDF